MLLSYLDLSSSHAHYTSQHTPPGPWPPKYLNPHLPRPQYLIPHSTPVSHPHSPPVSNPPLTPSISSPTHPPVSYTKEQLELANKVISKWQSYKYNSIKEALLRHAVLLKEANVISHELDKNVSRAKLERKAWC